MKHLKRIFLLTAVVAVFGLTSCTKQELNEDEVAIEKDEIKEGDI